MRITFASFIRVTLALVAVANLGVALLLPAWAMARTSAVHTHWTQTERSLVESGQLALGPAEHESDGFLYHEFAKPILEREQSERIALALYLLVQAGLLILAACLISDKRKDRGSPNPSRLPTG